MNKIYSFLLIFVLYFSNIINSYAHPLDISISTATIKENQIKINSYFHSFEIEYLLKENNIEFESVNDYFANQDIIKKYIQKNITIAQGNNTCNINNIEIKQDEVYKILTDWLAINYWFLCPKKVQEFDFQVEFFTQFPLQTNRFTFYDMNDWLSNSKPFYFKVFTSKITQKTINIDDQNLTITKDSDNDWISDEEEKIYYTDPFLADSDNDYYTDKEEIEWWWNPINPELWPGQEYRSLQEYQKIQSQQKQSNYTQQDYWVETLSDYGYSNWYLKKVMKYLDNFFTNNQWNIWGIFLLVFGLWVIHAAGPWHSKSLLIAYSLEKNNWFFKSFLFAIIFTITHILDILLLFLFTKILVWFVDISKFNYIIQVVSSVLLLILWIYLFSKALKNKNTTCENKEKKSLWIAFFAWLAPCSFAWSIFLLLIALWQSQWIFLLVWALWLWIFTTLVLIIVITLFLKTKAYKKFEQLESYSNMLSSAIILLIGILFIVKLL